jgi:hypothetical protein
VGVPNDDDNGSNSGSVVVFNRTGTNSWDGGTKLTDSGGAAGDEFGFSVSISGDYAVVGAPSDDDKGNTSGTAFLFHRTGTNSWDSGTKITASDGGAAYDQFGWSVSINGDYAIIGYPSDGDAFAGTKFGSADIKWIAP